MPPKLLCLLKEFRVRIQPTNTIPSSPPLKALDFLNQNLCKLPTLSTRKVWRLSLFFSNNPSHIPPPEIYQTLGIDPFRFGSQRSHLFVFLSSFWAGKRLPICISLVQISTPIFGCLEPLVSWDWVAGDMANWELRNCCQHEQRVFLAVIGVFTVVILALWRTVLLTPFKLITVFLHETSHALACKLTCGQVEGIQVHANEGGVTQTRGGIYWVILPAGYLGSSFWGMVLILASTNLLTAKIAAGCLGVALLIVLFVAQNWLLRGLCIGFIIFLGIVWLLQETTTVRILRYVILFIGVMNSLFSVYDIYDDLISRRVHSSDAEKFAELCPCPCNGVAWGVIWGFISFIFLCASMYLGLVILS